MVLLLLGVVFEIVALFTLKYQKDEMAPFAT